MNRNSLESHQTATPRSVLPFPEQPRRSRAKSKSCRDEISKRAERSAGDHALAALENVSRRIDDLARELGCLGFFDDESRDRPRAA